MNATAEFPLVPAVAAGIAWHGDDLIHSPSGAAILASIPDGWEPTADLLNFYNGDQWAPEVLERRQGRPCLVVNMLPRLYALAWDAGAGHPEDDERLKCWITYRNMEAQRLYNYMVSAAAEVAVEASPNKRLIDPAALGNAVLAAVNAANAYNRARAEAGEPLAKDAWAEGGMAAIDYYLKAERA
jgi:hypothetical protein